MENSFSRRRDFADIFSIRSFFVESRDEVLHNDESETVIISSIIQRGKKISGNEPDESSKNRIYEIF